MARGYWVTFYRSVSDPAALAKYASVATPIIMARGGRILGRGIPVKTYEAGLSERAVVIEFESVERAIATFECEEYQSAAGILSGAAERDIRIIQGA